MRARGFTLLEVLIAATIFFAAIVALSEAYRVSVEAQRRAEATIRMLTPVPRLMSRVENLLRENPVPLLEEEGLMFGVTYRIVARAEESFAPPARIDPDSDAYSSYEPRFSVYDVSLTLGFGGRKKTLNYRELAWSPLVTKTGSAASL